MFSARAASRLAPSYRFISQIHKPLIATLPKRHFENEVDSQGNVTPILRTTVLNPVKFLPEKHYVLHEQFGKFKNMYQPGLNTFLPFISDLVYVLSTENVYAVTHQDAITKDNASVAADGVIYYKIVDPKKAAYGVDDLLRSIENIVVTNLRTVIGDMELDALLKDRDRINQKLKTVVGPASKEWGVEVTRVEIRDIIPDKKLVQAMDQQMIAERDRRATETAAEGKKKATVLAAQAERERLENEATGKKEAAIRDAEAKLESAKKDSEARRVLADADAYTRETLANAEAKAIAIISDAIEKNPGVKEYLIAQGSVDAWKKLAGSNNNKVLLFPTGNSSIVTPLAAAAEMLGLTDKTQNPTPIPMMKKS